MQNFTVNEGVGKFIKWVACNDMGHIQRKARVLIKEPTFLISSFWSVASAEDCWQKAKELLARAGDFTPWSTLLWLPSSADGTEWEDQFVVIVTVHEPPTKLWHELLKPLDRGKHLQVHALPGHFYKHALDRFENGIRD